MLERKEVRCLEARSSELPSPELWSDVPKSWSWTAPPVSWTPRTNSRLDTLAFIFPHFCSRSPHVTPSRACSQQVNQALLDQTNNCTVLLISRNMSVVEKADHIVVLDDGRVKEEGRHDELLAKGGLYCELLKSENKGFHREREDKQWHTPTAAGDGCSRSGTKAEMFLCFVSWCFGGPKCMNIHYYFISQKLVVSIFFW